jgi:nucleoside-diphosphate-sugar epimerase
MNERILITGAAGAIGTMLRHRMGRPQRILRLLDIAPLRQPEPGEQIETVEADITDLGAMKHAAHNVDAIIHLGGIAHESDWQSILHTNIHGTYTVLEAARTAGVPRVILASSNHAVGFHPYSDELVPDYVFPGRTPTTASAKRRTRHSAACIMTGTASTCSAYGSDPVSKSQQTTEHSRRGCPRTTAPG